ncbi:uncharacterized protein LOC129599996 [Paramacrobiotus metropolitanus]|uniref:uncharacterized protein LOC129599996 n=1 Tax=Paramacrobiotus metropolitanus TaxID=2943436 RepID=UPI0024456715|nr:uncharacterized protein LOC129599996 [Paramacrobiotus metropolitanus]
MLRQITLFSLAVFARIVVSLDCEELAAQCQEYGKQERLTVERLMSLSISWPLTAEALREYQPLDEAFSFAVFSMRLLCRYSNNTGHCVRNLLTSCPEFLQDNPSGWFDSEMLIAKGRLCATSIAPVQYYRALSHCRQHDPTLQQSVRRAAEATARDEVEDVPVNSHPVCGHVEYCHVNAAGIEDASGEAGAKMAAYCGAEAVETLRESAVQIYAAHCLNENDSDNAIRLIQR